MKIETNKIINCPDCERELFVVQSIDLDDDVICACGCLVLLGDYELGTTTRSVINSLLWYSQN